MRKRRAKSTQKNATAATQLFARPEDWDRLEARVLELVMAGHTVGAAERIATAELRKGHQIR